MMAVVTMSPLRLRRCQRPKQDCKTKNRKHCSLQRHVVSSIVGILNRLPSMVRARRLQRGFLNFENFRRPKDQERSTSMVPLRVRKGNTFTFACSGSAATPVRQSNAQACHGHTTVSPSTHPCPKGPCRCGHQFSSACSSPPTLARQYVPPSHSTSRTSSFAGPSPAAHKRFHSPTRQIPFPQT